MLVDEVKATMSPTTSITEFWMVGAVGPSPRIRDTLVEAFLQRVKRILDTAQVAVLPGTP
jgi:hypothetical protein